ncbi:MAG: N-acetyl-gamma-glutamyl-phosphate reductase [Litorilinea sp.]
MANQPEHLYRVGIAGATGYTGYELLQIIHRHPHLQVGWLTSENSAGKTIGEVHAAPWDYPLIAMQDALQRTDDVDVVFLCLPHAASIEPVRAFQATGVRCIDLSADFRLKNPAAYAQWYGEHTAPDLLPQFVYGLCEVYRAEIRDAKLIAVPGCYPTSVNLGLYPLAKAGWLEQDIIVDSKSGVSGAGRQSKVQYSYVEVNENMSPYNIGYRHRHIAEMEQVLGGVARNGAGQNGAGATHNGTGVPHSGDNSGDTSANNTGYNFLFSPHLLPVNRGILSTMYVRVTPGVTEEDIRNLYTETYAGEPFIHLLPAGQLASLRHVTHTNRVAISILPANPNQPENRQYIIVTTLDNLVKGASGQAVQNFNIAVGLEETLGLL